MHIFAFNQLQCHIKKIVFTFVVMSSRIAKAYWLCQAGGWGMLGLVYIFFHVTISEKTDPYFFQNLILFLVEGVAFSHLIRFIIRQFKLLKLPLNRQITSMLLTVLVTAFLFAACDILLITFLKINSDAKESSILTQVMRNWFGTMLFLIIWVLIYFTYHYIVVSQNEQLDKANLANLVKELQLKTIKAHINPHFIFNALNSIRALVDENPGRARKAVTELSNILRSSLQAEKLETAPLERELNLVKDYLELEYIRFEERLKVEYEIDEDTLDQQVPPMMLQIMVENAIKHGISKHVDGGMIRIISDYNKDHYELSVQNTGRLEASTSPDGFGIASTHNRLKLLYGVSGVFEIKNIEGNMVESKITIPVDHI